MTREDWLSAKPLVLAGLVLLAIFFSFVLALQLRQLLAVLFLGVILGVTLNPFTEAMSRLHVPRIVAILFVYTVTAILLGLVFVYAGMQIADENFADDINTLRRDYEDLRQDTFLPPVEEVEGALVTAARGTASGLAGRVFTGLSILVGIATILFTAILFSITQTRARNVLLSFVPPANRQRTTQLLGKYATGLRQFARGELIAMIVVGAVTFIGLSLIGVPMAALLALIAAIFELLPLIGPFIAAFPAIIVAFTQGPFVALQVGLLYLLIQQFESYVVTPLVHSRESEVPALLIFISITVGGALMGIVGALIALPIAVLLRITYMELIVPWNKQRFGEAIAPGEEGYGVRVIFRLEDRRGASARTPAEASHPGSRPAPTA